MALLEDAFRTLRKKSRTEKSTYFFDAVADTFLYHIILLNVVFYGKCIAHIHRKKYSAFHSHKNQQC